MLSRLWIAAAKGYRAYYFSAYGYRAYGFTLKTPVPVGPSIGLSVCKSVGPLGVFVNDQNLISATQTTTQTLKESSNKRASE